MPREMTQAEVTDFLTHGTRTANVATTMSNGQPHVMPAAVATARSDDRGARGISSSPSRRGTAGSA